MLVWAVVAMVVDLELGFVSLSNNEDFLDSRECLPKAITVRAYTYTFKEKKMFWPVTLKDGSRGASLYG